MLKEAEANQDTLILGVRNFTQKKGIKISLRSKFGNTLTSIVFKYLLGINISDTQTGLRAFSQKQMKDFLKVKGEKFEYETNMLIENKNLGYKFKEKEIDTIYIENNESSHFNPIRDSISIYSLFLKYTAVSVLSFLIDIFLFKIFITANFSIIISTVTSRIISSIFNYMMNKNKVFKTFNNKNLFKYYMLVIIQMFVSSYSLKFLVEITKNKNLISLKIIVDIIIFMINFYIQRE